MLPQKALTFWTSWDCFWCTLRHYLILVIIIIIHVISWLYVCDSLQGCKGRGGLPPSPPQTEALVSAGLQMSINAPIDNTRSELSHSLIPVHVWLTTFTCIFVHMHREQAHARAHPVYSCDFINQLADRFVTCLVASLARGPKRRHLE